MNSSTSLALREVSLSLKLKPAHQAIPIRCGQAKAFATTSAPHPQIGARRNLQLKLHSKRSALERNLIHYSTLSIEGSRLLWRDS